MVSTTGAWEPVGFSTPVVEDVVLPSTLPPVDEDVVMGGSAAEESVPGTLLGEPAETPLCGIFDLAAVRVKIQRLSDEFEEALVSLEKLCVLLSPATTDAYVQTLAPATTDANVQTGSTVELCRYEVGRRLGSAAANYTAPPPNLDAHRRR